LLSYRKYCIIFVALTSTVLFSFLSSQPFFRPKPPFCSLQDQIEDKLEDWQLQRGPRLAQQSIVYCWSKEYSLYWNSSKQGFLLCICTVLVSVGPCLT